MLVPRVPTILWSIAREGRTRSFSTFDKKLSEQSSVSASSRSLSPLANRACLRRTPILISSGPGTALPAGNALRPALGFGDGLRRCVRLGWWEAMGILSDRGFRRELPLSRSLNQVHGLLDKLT